MLSLVSQGRMEVGSDVVRLSCKVPLTYPRSPEDKQISSPWSKYCLVLISLKVWSEKWPTSAIVGYDPLWGNTYNHVRLHL